jgi:hypothetical protein
MRRIYYAFAIRLGTHPISLSLAIFVVSLYVLAKLVFVAKVVDGFLAIPRSEIIPHALKVLNNADGLSLIVFGVCIMALLSVGFNIKMPKFNRGMRIQTA